MSNKIFSVLLVSILLSCGYKNRDTEQIKELLLSESIDDVFEGNFLAGKQKEEGLVYLILKDADDPKIIHNIKYKGMSIYQSKMMALKNISGLEPTSQITHKPDSSIVAFYTEWAFERGLLYSDR
ncbi:hypothetical protein [Ulvibacterium marinum]|uniref:hypothetical protein n=1 Tax=Ulvibacterium marinum TaxID=2419782 RepID=UPI0024953A9F|nr:hypothetical protein [Ulvibacterium marinum]